MARDNALSVSFFLQPVQLELCGGTEQAEYKASRKTRTDLLIPSFNSSMIRSNYSDEGKSV